MNRVELEWFDRAEVAAQLTAILGDDLASTAADAVHRLGAGGLPPGPESRR